MTADGHELVELEIWSASPHEIGFGPRLHASPDVLSRWIDIAAAACAGIFGGRPAWFVADWERARTWAFPDSFEPEHSLDNGGQEIRVARAPGCSVDLFATLMRSHDVGWDAIAIIDGTITAADIVPLLRPCNRRSIGATQRCARRETCCLRAAMVWYCVGVTPGAPPLSYARRCYASPGCVPRRSDNSSCATRCVADVIVAASTHASAVEPRYTSESTGWPRSPPASRALSARASVAAST